MTVISKTLSKSTIADFALTATLAAGPARANAGFAAPKGIAVEPISAADMEAAQGKLWLRSVEWSLSVLDRRPWRDAL
jgi:hypothetical protein